MNLTPDQVRSILGIPAGEPVGNALAFMVRWHRMVLGREYGELTIRLQAGREIGWTEHVTHREVPMKLSGNNQTRIEKR